MPQHKFDPFDFKLRDYDMSLPPNYYENLNKLSEREETLKRMLVTAKLANIQDEIIDGSKPQPKLSKIKLRSMNELKLLMEGK